MYCIHCGVPLPNEARFCYQCGKPVYGGTGAETLPASLPLDPQIRRFMQNYPQFKTLIYTDRVPDEERAMLEGTDRELVPGPCDAAAREELDQRLAQYYALPPFTDYIVHRHVPAAALGVDPRATDVNFLFERYGRQSLAVILVKLNCASHIAVSSVVDQLRARGVPVLLVHIGYPNREHYLIRRTSELLRLPLGAFRCVYDSPANA